MTQARQSRAGWWDRSFWGNPRTHHARVVKQVPWRAGSKRGAGRDGGALRGRVVVVVVLLSTGGCCSRPGRSCGVVCSRSRTQRGRLCGCVVPRMHACATCENCYCCCVQTQCGVQEPVAARSPQRHPAWTYVVKATCGVISQARAPEALCGQEVNEAVPVSTWSMHTASRQHDHDMACHAFFPLNSTCSSFSE